MPIFLIFVFVAVISAGPDALAQWREGNQDQLAEYCRPPSKFAAGACVQACPAGYEDRGRVCIYRSQSGGSGGQ